MMGVAMPGVGVAHGVACGVALAIVLGVPSSADAQERPDTFRLRDVVVTATRLPTPAAAAPGSITVLTAADLRQRGIRFVSDAMRLVPGTAVVQSAGPGAQTSVFMRGGESDYVQVLIDGVQVNDPGGSYDWAHLRAEDIDRIEIVRGPSSVLYGSDAVSGVVQIFTRAGGRPRVEASMSSARGSKYTGSRAFVTNSFDASLSGAAPMTLVEGTLRYGLSAAQLGSNGLYESNSDYDNRNLSARLQLAAARGDLAVMLRRGDHEYQYPTTGSGAIVEREQFATGENLSLAADGGFRPARRLEIRVLATSHVSDGRTENPPSAVAEGSFWSTSEQTRRKIDARMNAFLPAGAVLTAGVERQWQTASTALESVSSFGIFTDSTDEERNNTGWYGQLHGGPLHGVALTLGGRIDVNDAFGTFRTARAALSWTPLPGARLHGSYGTAFKEPTFFESFATGFTRGNPDLEPEQARSGEAGLEYGFAEGAVTAGATWFHQRFRNLIQYTAAPPPDAPNYVNIGAARAQGAELFLRGEHKHLSWSAGYTLTQTRVLDEGFGADVAFQAEQRLLRRPEHQATISAGYRIGDGLRILADARHAGERDDLDFTDPAQWQGIRTVLPAHTVIDVGAEYAILRGRSSSLELTARLRNVTDERYQEIFNFPTAGRVLQVGVRAGVGY
ncbi:TonB-dependent vitamin B12 receptor [soil metagenome]